MVLGPADSGTTFVSAAGGRAWLSGGRVIRAADAAWQPIPGSKALKAALFFFLFFSFFLFFFFFLPALGERRAWLPLALGWLLSQCWVGPSAESVRDDRTEAVARVERIDGLERPCRRKAAVASLSTRLWTQQ